jgi:hypothetical protein
MQGFADLQPAVAYGPMKRKRSRRPKHSEMLKLCPLQQQEEKAPPGHFKVQLPLTGVAPGQVKTHWCTPVFFVSIKRQHCQPATGISP